MRTGPALLPNWAKTKWARWNHSASLSYNRSNKLQNERRVHTISSGHGPVSEISWLHICWAHRSQVTIDYVIQGRSVTGLSPDLCWESAWIQFEFTTSGAAHIKVHHCNVLASLICTSVFCNVPNFLILTLPLRSLGKHEIQCSQIVWQLLSPVCQLEATLTHCIAKLTVGRRSKSTLQMLLKVDTSQNYYISQMCHRDTFFMKGVWTGRLKNNN